jgi:nitrogen-specific signal transduction histidine kinase/ActR/RegA family two-component response regulator
LLAGYTIDNTDRCKEEEERLNLERQLFYIHKMESLGRMSSGIAHDFNNLLQAVLGNLELALMKLPVDSNVCRHISQASLAAERAATLSGLMLAYSGRAAMTARELNLNNLVEEYFRLLNASIPGSITFEIKLAKALPLIKADAGLLEQVLMSLIANSSEAIGDAEGSITISTGVDDFDQAVLDRSRLEEKLPAGRYVWIEVRDSGCGMDDDTLYKLFDPFFTTKFTGRGLSMSATHGIIRIHRGGIFVESRPDSGTVIRILFPIVETSSAEAELHSDGHPAAQPEAIQADDVVLFIDDDETARMVIVSMLEQLGFKVVAVSDSERACRALREQLNRICVVLLNKSLPRVEGINLINELKSIKTDVKILLASGYSEEEVVERFRGVAIDGFMQKPFSMGRLENELQRLIIEKQM